MKYRIPLLAVFATASIVAFAAPVAGDLPALRDQFGAPVSLAAEPDQVRVAIVVSARKLRRIKPWEKALREEFPDLVVVRVADVPRTSPTEYDTVAKKLRKRLPEDVPVGIDLEGKWAELLGLDTSVPNILVFNTAGALAYQQSGMYKKSRYPALQGALLDITASQVAATAGL